jgi:plastocyanin
MNILGPSMLYIPNIKAMKNSVGSVSRLMIYITLFCAVLTISNSCTKDTTYNTGDTGGNNTGGPGQNEVWIKNMVFNPSTITVAAGTTIKWTNKDPAPHTATSTDNLFDTGTLGTNESSSIKFSNAGSFSYICTIHTSMKGTVIVN